MSGRLGEDVAALAAIVRDSAGAGERESARWLAGRLRELGVDDVAIEPYRGPRTYAWAHLVHALAGLAAAARGSRALALAALASYELEVSGRLPWVRRLLPAGEGANVVGRIPAAGRRRRTLVLVAHHDAARTGLMWHPRLVNAGAALRNRRRVSPPAAGALGLAALATATGTRAGRRIGGAVHALAAALLLDVARSPTVPGANDNASGVAGALELARRLVARPLDGAEVVVALTGAEESGMAGMAAFLDAHPLDPGDAFVLGLDTIGSGRPIVAVGEATLLPHRYREADVAFVERAARDAGLAPPERWRTGAWTDPVLATFRGLPAVSLLSVDAQGGYGRYHVPQDTPEHVDLGSVARCVDLAEAVARAL
ncbi:MAG: M20/M25/M40 family metallo-hydrolase [Solirubrobacteraceae bacterium]|nr:M20/M25/M40 family metallo-hydrolase [Solirubrobacteraceae bacterium]